MYNEDLNEYKQWLECVIDKHLGKKSTPYKKLVEWAKKELEETKNLLAEEVLNGQRER